ncbi:hypothetical protein ACIA8I_39485 [Streptomyces rishiriensis]|uniref:hypothetical protein n=1 Tax=Streptomyces rishiriensis TaxID=68264 RepID=UPI00379D704D
MTFVDFVAQVFGGEELGRVSTEDGLIGHGEIRVGDTVVPAFDRHADWPRMPSLLRVFVADPFGNIWWGVSYVEDVSEAEMWRRRRDPVYEAIRVVQETLDAELSGQAHGRSSAPVRAIS